MLYNSIKELIGNTPLVRLKKTEELFSLNAKLYAKIESFNPTGSSKDRTVYEILRFEKARGKLKKGDTCMEATSGNTGIALAFLCAVDGYHAVVVMPENVSKERISWIKAFGGTVILTPKKDGMLGAKKEAERLSKRDKRVFLLNQFENPSNVEAHKKTGLEIDRDLNGKTDIFVAGIGSGGTLTGVERVLKEKNPSVKIVGVEPSSSPLFTKGKTGSHKLQGLGADFVPKILGKEQIDEIIDVSDKDAYRYTKLLVKTEALPCGISSGAVLCAGIKLAKRKENAKKNIVLLFPDTLSRYFSTDLYE